MKYGFSMLIPMNEEEKNSAKIAAKKAGYSFGGLVRKLLLEFTAGKTEQVYPQKPEETA